MKKQCHAKLRGYVNDHLTSSCVRPLVCQSRNAVHVVVACVRGWATQHFSNAPAACSSIAGRAACSDA